MDQALGEEKANPTGTPVRKPARIGEYRVDNKRIERLQKGFLFGISLSDLFILLAAVLAVLVLQLGPKAFKYLESSSQQTTGETGLEPSTVPPQTITPPPATDSGEKVVSQKVFCNRRPQVCTQECLIGPPYICGSDGKAKCSPCQACADPDVDWYVLQSTPCPRKPQTR